MKERFEDVQIEIIKLEEVDIITASPCNNESELGG